MARFWIVTAMLVGLVQPAKASEEEAGSRIRAARDCLATVGALRGDAHFGALKLDAFMRGLASQVDYAEAWIGHASPAKALDVLADDSCEARLTAWFAANRPEPPAKPVHRPAVAGGWDANLPELRPAPDASLVFRLLGMQRGLARPSPNPAMTTLAQRDDQERLYAIYGRLK